MGTGTCRGIGYGRALDRQQQQQQQRTRCCGLRGGRRRSARSVHDRPRHTIDVRRSMAASVVEQIRSFHEDIEQAKISIVDDFLKHRPKTNKGELSQQHRLKKVVEEIQRSSQTLAKLYEDEDGQLREELNLTNPENVFKVFYEQLKDVRESHRQFRGGLLVPQSSDGYAEDEAVPSAKTSAPVVSSEPLVRFSGEEKFGKYVDMFALHDQFINLDEFKGEKRIEYKEYLTTFSSSLNTLLTKGPARSATGLYMTKLLDYLMDFHSRIHPLYPVEKIIAEIEEDFKTNPAALAKDKSTEYFCVPCGKQFMKETVLQAHKKSKKHIRKAADIEQGEVPTRPINGTQLLAYKIEVFADMLSDICAATRYRLEAQQSRTYAEIQAEKNEESEEESASDEDTDDESVIYNPKNIPLGWDGKPIPYWLYKLHGLNIEYKCEICGNYSYMGPRAFERHFTEWRHVNGMKALQIPNSHHFKFVNKIDDAIALYRKVKSTEKQRNWRPEDEEELEDKQGNVFKKKTYDDLKRQGII